MTVQGRIEIYQVVREGLLLEGILLGVQKLGIIELGVVYHVLCLDVLDVVCDDVLGDLLIEEVSGKGLCVAELLIGG